jgi:hypothetical protein
MINLLLNGQFYEISDFRFFHKSVYSEPVSILLGSFQIFAKIFGDIHSSTQGAPPVLLTLKLVS